MAKPWRVRIKDRVRQLEALGGGVINGLGPGAPGYGRRLKELAAQLSEDEFRSLVAPHETVPNERTPG